MAIELAALSMTTGCGTVTSTANADDLDGARRPRADLTQPPLRISLHCAASGERLTAPAKGDTCCHSPQCNFDALAKLGGETCPVSGCKVKISAAKLNRADALRRALRSFRSKREAEGLALPSVVDWSVHDNIISVPAINFEARRVAVKEDVHAVALLHSSSPPSLQREKTKAISRLRSNRSSLSAPALVCLVDGEGILAKSKKRRHTDIEANEEAEVRCSPSKPRLATPSRVRPSRTEPVEEPVDQTPKQPQAIRVVPAPPLAATAPRFLVKSFPPGSVNIRPTPRPNNARGTGQAPPLLPRRSPSPCPSSKLRLPGAHLHAPSPRHVTHTTHHLCSSAGRMGR